MLSPRYRAMLLLGLSATFVQACKRNKSEDAHEKLEARAKTKVLGVEPLKLGLYKKGTQDLQWIPINDKVVGGRSTAELKVISPGSKGRTHALEVKGSIEKGDFPFPFAGTQLNLKEILGTQSKSFDISKWSGVSFWAKGDGRKYYLRFNSASIYDYNFHHFAFEATDAWKEHKVPFDALVQFSWGKKAEWTGKDITAISFANYDKPGSGLGPILLQVDNILFY